MTEAVPSRSTTTWLDFRAALSIVPTMVSSVTSSITVSDSGRPGRWAHRDTGRFGSASMTVTLSPDPASSQASRTAEMDLPAPPLGLAKTHKGTGPSPSRCEPPPS